LLVVERVDQVPFAVDEAVVEALPTGGACAATTADDARFIPFCSSLSNT
jgi:hypothetical protein